MAATVSGFQHVPGAPASLPRSVLVGHPGQPSATSTMLALFLFTFTCTIDERVKGSPSHDLGKALVN